MIDKKGIGKIVISIMAISLAAVMIFVYGFSSNYVSAVEYEYEDGLFNSSEIIEVNVEIDEDSWQELLDNATAEEYYECDVEVNGEKYESVGIRAKGNTSLSMVASSDSDRYSFKINFDEYVSGQTCEGLSKLILNNNYADATMMKEAIVYDMYAYLGADAPLYSYAKVSINGSYYGLYLALEPVEEEFLMRNYGTSYGQLYKPDTMEMGGGRGNMKSFDMDSFNKKLNPDEDDSSTDDSASADDESSVSNGSENMSGNGMQPPDMQNGEQGEQPPAMPDGEQGGNMGPGGFGGQGGQPPEMPNGEQGGNMGPGGFGGQGGQPPEMPDGEQSEQQSEMAGGNQGGPGGRMGPAGPGGNMSPVGPGGNMGPGGPGEQGGQSADIQDGTNNGSEPPAKPDEEQEGTGGQPPEMPNGEQGEQPPEMPDGGQDGPGGNGGQGGQGGNGGQGGQGGPGGNGGHGGPGGGGGFGSGSSNLNYIDDEEDSYSTLWNSDVLGTSTESDHNKLIASLKEICEGDLSYDELCEYMDVDNMLKYLAVHDFAVNLDSLSGNMAHNYYLYEDDGVLNMIPWDYNLSFGGFQSGNASDVINFPVDTPFSSSISEDDRQFFYALLNNDECLEIYHSYLEKLCNEYVNGGVFDNKYNEIKSLISAYVKDDPTAFYSYDEFEAGTEMIYKVVKLRAESVLGQISGTIPSTWEGQEADSESLVNCDDVNIKIMGTQGGGNEKDKKDHNEEHNDNDSL